MTRVRRAESVLDPTLPGANGALYEADRDHGPVPELDLEGRRARLEGGEVEQSPTLRGAQLRLEGDEVGVQTDPAALGVPEPLGPAQQLASATEYGSGITGPPHAYRLEPGSRKAIVFRGRRRQASQPLPRVERSGFPAVVTDHDVAPAATPEVGTAALAAFTTSLRADARGLLTDRARPEQVSDRQGQSLPKAARKRSFHTFQTASRMIRFDILDWPSVLSTNTMGISPMRNPLFHARMLISI